MAHHHRPQPSFSLQIFAFLLESNRPDVARTHPAPSQLVDPRAQCIITRINRLTRGKQREVSVSRRPVIPEVPQARISREVAGQEGDCTAARVTNQVVAERDQLTSTVRRLRLPRKSSFLIAGQDCVDQGDRANPCDPSPRFDVTQVLRDGATPQPLKQWPLRQELVCVFAS